MGVPTLNPEGAQICCVGVWGLSVRGIPRKARSRLTCGASCPSFPCKPLVGCSLLHYAGAIARDSRTCCRSASRGSFGSRHAMAGLLSMSPRRLLGVMRRPDKIRINPLVSRCDPRRNPQTFPTSNRASPHPGEQIRNRWALTLRGRTCGTAACFPPICKARCGPQSGG
jgi:hypothetical protein